MCSYKRDIWYGSCNVITGLKLLIQKLSILTATIDYIMNCYCRLLLFKDLQISTLIKWMDIDLRTLNSLIVWPLPHESHSFPITMSLSRFYEHIYQRQSVDKHSKYVSYSCCQLWKYIKIYVIFHDCVFSEHI